MLNKIVIIIFLFLCSNFIFAQNNRLDSLLRLIKTEANDTNKVKHLNQVVKYYDTDVVSALSYANEALTLATKLDFKRGIANSYATIGSIYANRDDYSDGLKNFFTSLQMYKALNNKEQINNCYSNIGVIYNHQGNYSEALKMHFAALKISEEISNKQDIADAYLHIGIDQDCLGNYAAALKSYDSALKLQKEIDDKQGIAYTYNNIGLIFDIQGNYSKALSNYFESLKRMQEIGIKHSRAHVYINIAVIQMIREDYANALVNNLEALKLYQEFEDKDGIASAYINLGELHLKQHLISKAKDYLYKGLNLSLQIGSKEPTKDSYKKLVGLDSMVGDYKAAFEHHKLFVLYRDSLNNEEIQRNSMATSMQYEFDKKQLAINAEQDKKDVIANEEKQKQKIITYAIGIGFIIVLILGLFILHSYRQKQKANKIITQQKSEVENQKHLVEEKHKEITDSIQYAKRIQTALMSNEKYIDKTINRLNKNG